ncbi:unnamed protein product [Alternaria alternata]
MSSIYRPSTPDQMRPTLSRSSTYSVAPKSEFLRHALEARRAQNTPTPSPQEVKAPPPPTSMPLDIHTPKTSPDVFDEFALTEEQTTPVSPIRRRRPSDVGTPRSKTNRDLTNDIQKLKESLMTSNMRVELLKKDNRELQHQLTTAKEQVERLEPLEDENYELRAENKQLKLKLDKMSEEISSLREDNEEQRMNNVELTAIASETAAHFTEHETALAEAAECIIKMEEEKALLDKELKMLKERVMVIESHSPASTLVNTPGKYPPSVYSVDEERPTTSHFDSDYYSQVEDTPSVKPSHESIRSFTPSERSKKFLDLTEERRKSARDLSERMSAVSLKALREASPSPLPEVPQVPTTYQQEIPTIIADDRSATPSRTPVPHRQDPREDRDGWWRSLDRLTLPQALAQQQQQQQQQQQKDQRDQQTPRPSKPHSRSRSVAPLPPPIDTGNTVRTTNGLNAYVDTLRSSGSRRKPGETTPLTALNSHPVEKDFLFNVKESEDDFLRKTRGSVGSSSRRS